MGEACDVRRGSNSGRNPFGCSGSKACGSHDHLQKDPAME